MRIERAEAMDRVTVERLRAVGRGEEPEVLSISYPDPLVTFGRRDELRPGFEAASAAARARGFDVSVRRVGGRAAAYHHGCLIVNHLRPDREATGGNLRRYRDFGRLYADALGSLGVAADVGELPHEYCPGEYSVHGALPEGGATKLVGTAQRVVAGAWWFSAAVVVTRRDPLVAVLTEVYADLGLDLDPGTIGSVEQIIPEIRREDVEDAVIEHYERWERTCADDM